MRRSASIPPQRQIPLRHPAHQRHISAPELFDPAKARDPLEPKPGPLFGYAELMELIFEIRDAEEGGYYARALGHGIFTEGDSWEELRANLLEAVSLHFEDAAERPRLVQMHYVKDELIPLEAA